MEEGGVLKKRRISKENGGAEGHRKLVLKALRNVLGDEEATFRGEQQGDALVLVSDGRKDGLIVFPTGSGKSMMFLVPAAMNKTKICIVVVPLVALADDLMRRCTLMGIQAVYWRDRYTAGARIVLASAEHIIKEDYRAFVEETHARRALHAIFVDEAHLFLQWADFRPVLNLVHEKIRPKSAAPVPLFAMTATCPPSMEKDICRQLALEAPHVIRQCGSRRNISYRVQRVDEEDLRYGVSQRIRSDVSMFGTDKSTTIRMIMYCTTRSECEELANVLRFTLSRKTRLFKYHAGMEKEERTEEYLGWSSNVAPGTQTAPNVSVMVTTCAFGCGVDIPDVRVVYHLRVPDTAIGFLQESGRDGRDGKKALSVVLWPDSKGEAERNPTDVGINPENMVEKDPAACIPEMWNRKHRTKADPRFGTMHAFMSMNSVGCRRWALDKYNDNVSGQGRCAERGMEVCDVCEDLMERGKKSVTRSEDHESVPLNRSRDGQRRSDNGRHGVDTVINLIGDSLGGKGEGGLGTNGQVPGNSTPRTSRKLFQSPAGRSRTAMRYESPGPSQSVTPTVLTTMTVSDGKLCAVCSILHRKRTSHYDGKEDEQNMECFKRRCLRCGMTGHGCSKCFMETFKQRTGWCFMCTMDYHVGQDLHKGKQYGTSGCPNKNSLRMIMIIFQEKETRKLMNDRFPAVVELNRPEEVM